MKTIGLLGGMRWESTAHYYETRLAPEAHSKGWLSSPAMAADPLFSTLLGAGVSFYDTQVSLKAFPSAGLPPPGGALPSEYE
jgi:hypothetical protein